MRNESPSHEIIVQYILGELSETETQQIEEKYFAAPEFLNELECTSDELLTDYLQNNLPHAQKIKLEQRCQQLPLLGTKLAIHRLFASYPKQTSLTVATAPHATSAFFFGAPKAIATLAAALGIFLLAFGTYWGWLKKSHPPQNIMVATAQAVRVSPAVATPQITPKSSSSVVPIEPPREKQSRARNSRVTSFFLFADKVRGQTTIPQFAIPPRAAQVHLQVEVINKHHSLYPPVPRCYSFANQKNSERQG